ncbi:hypothetical protein GCM10018791_25090 [Streptomyces zaomyceticus]|nr:hypothetical protein GCM10018791_25090 [Streptomyces zaomyceticus]
MFPRLPVGDGATPWGRWVSGRGDIPTGTAGAPAAHRARTASVPGAYRAYAPRARLLTVSLAGPRLAFVQK